MKVAALCDCPSQVVPLWRNRLPGVALTLLLVKNDPRSSQLRFLLIVLSHFLRRTDWSSGLLALRLWLGGRLRVVPSALHHPKVVAWLEQQGFDVGLHQVGTLYRENLIRVFRRGLINPHAGWLPAYRGRSVVEWSLLQGAPTGISAFFIDTGIDTGRELLVWQPVSVRGLFADFAAVYRHLAAKDGEMFNSALKALQQNRRQGENPPGAGRRHYVMSNLLQGVALNLLRSGRYE